MTIANHKKNRTQPGTRGVSLVELLLVITIILILGGIAIPKVMQSWWSVQLRSSAGEVASLMQQARITAAKNNATYALRYQTTNGRLQAYLDLNNNSSWDSATEPVIELPQKITAATGAPSGSGQPSAYVLVGDSSTGTPYDNSNTLAFSPRGLPCNYSGGTCVTPATTYFVYYFQNGMPNGWAAIVVTKSGRTKAMIWNGSSWN